MDFAGLTLKGCAVWPSFAGRGRGRIKRNIPDGETWKELITNIQLDVPDFLELLRLAKIGERMQWVSVMPETMPEYDKEIFLTDGEEIGKGFLDKEIGFVIYKGSAIVSGQVTHWMPLMPLPLAPEGGAE